MQIDRSDYEIWLIDWLDGKLDELQVQQLQHFLAENPDLNDEFGDLENIRLNAGENKFLKKNHLRKTSANLSESQFDLLCAAYLENDLTEEECSELEETISKDDFLRKEFELIQKTKISPVTLIYKNKKGLIRRSVFEKTIRLALIGISAAAIIVVALLTYFIPRSSISDKNETSARTTVTDTLKNQANKSIAPENKTLAISHPKKPGKIHITPPSIVTLPDSSLQADVAIHVTAPEMVTVNKSEIFTEKMHPENQLIALEFKFITPDYDDGSSRIGKFLARVVREKILKEKNVKDTPLQIYEIAKASVSEINKLLGWEMALNERKDANGELKSVYFNSKILKFNAPVKKSENNR
jgi:hypothetical protein